MKIGAPTEKTAGEARVALTPDSAKQLKKLGHECLIQKGAGKLAGFSDKAYEEAGVIVVSTAKALWESSDVVIKVQKPEKTELAYLDKSKTLIGFFWPGQNRERWKLPEKQGKRYRNGYGAPYFTCTKDGRVVLNGKYRGLSCGHRGRQ